MVHCGLMRHCGMSWTKISNNTPFCQMAQLNRWCIVFFSFVLKQSNQDIKPENRQLLQFYRSGPPGSWYWFSVYLQRNVCAVPPHKEQMPVTTGSTLPTGIMLNVNPQLVALVRSGEIVQLHVNKLQNAQLISVKHQCLLI